MAISTRGYADTAERVAREAGRILVGYFEQLERIDLKGHGNPVTIADRTSEKYVREAFLAEYPDIPVFGEEYGMDGHEIGDIAKACWVVDPLDGTVNFATGSPIFAVSIGLLMDGSPVVGVIFDPLRNQMFTATLGGGATRNGVPMRVSERKLSDGISPVGVSGDIIRSRPEFLQHFSKGRSIGSAALQLSYVAAGIFDAALDEYTSLWDVAAGWLLVHEAGGVTTHWGGAPIFPKTKDDPAFRSEVVNFVASNGLEHDLLAEWTKG
ncbi:MAG: inositol monophosphatase family protein [Candidatus Poribacteria bacterium]|nr:inositol monophosphatase family protein [Candidatus Poribacteria bacterium]